MKHSECLTLMSNLKGMAIIFLTALILCLIILMVLQFGFHMDTKVDYFVSFISAAIAISILCIKYMEADKELQRIENKNNKIIQLQNKVKIRYINNKNLKDYLCIKFNVEHSKILEKLHTQYLKEKEERAQFAEASEKAEFLQEDLVALLKRYRIKYPERFMNQVEAILDNKELIEYRHELIIQRQALRKQIEHNNELIHKAKHEITDIVIMYPKYATEITALVDLYDKKF